MLWADLTRGLIGYMQQQVSSSDFTTLQPAFANALPIIVNNAELRIYRELDFLATTLRSASFNTTSNNPLVSLSAAVPSTEDPTAAGWVARPVVVQRFRAQVTAPSTYVEAIQVSLDLLEQMWPNEASAAPPGRPFFYFALWNYETLKLAPTPDAVYPVDVVATWRPAPMSAANTETWLGDNASDLLFAACMVEAAGWQRDYGSQSDDPKLAMSWEATYQEHKRGAMEEEARRRGFGPGWAPYAPTPQTGTPRR